MQKPLGDWTAYLGPRNGAHRAISIHGNGTGSRYVGTIGKLEEQKDCTLFPILVGHDYDEIMDYVFEPNGPEVTVVETPTGMTLIIKITTIYHKQFEHMDIIQIPLKRLWSSAKNVEEATELEDEIAHLKRTLAILRAS